MHRDRTVYIGIATMHGVCVLPIHKKMHEENNFMNLVVI